VNVKKTAAINYFKKLVLFIAVYPKGHKNISKLIVKRRYATGVSKPATTTSSLRGFVVKGMKHRYITTDSSLFS